MNELEIFCPEGVARITSGGSLLNIVMTPRKINLSFIEKRIQACAKALAPLSGCSLTPDSYHHRMYLSALSRSIEDSTKLLNVLKKTVNPSADGELILENNFKENE